MNLTAHKLSEEQAKEISNWKYTGEHSIYNLPSWDRMVQENYSLTDAVGARRLIGHISKGGGYGH